MISVELGGKKITFQVLFEDNEFPLLIIAERNRVSCTISEKEWITYRTENKESDVTVQVKKEHEFDGSFGEEYPVTVISFEGVSLPVNPRFDLPVLSDAQYDLCYVVETQIGSRIASIRVTVGKMTE